MEAAKQVTAQSSSSLLVRMAGRFGVDAGKLHATLKATAFKGDVSDAQFMALMIVADQYKLNPITREIFAFPDRQNGIVPVVSVDGWSRIVNEHPQFDGVEFAYGPESEKHKSAPSYIDCTIYRKDRSHPTTIRERLVECYRDTGPWNSHPSRMLRHKVFIQCARAAFGFAGIYDEDEGQRIVEGTVSRVTESPALATINEKIKTSEPSPPAAAEFSDVALLIENAANADQLDLALDQIRNVAGDVQQQDLRTLADGKRKEMAK